MRIPASNGQEHILPEEMNLVLFLVCIAGRSIPGPRLKDESEDLSLETPSLSMSIPTVLERSQSTVEAV